MSSSSTPVPIVPILLELAKNRSSISQAIDAAVQVNSTVNDVKTDRDEYAGLGEDAAKLVYVIETELREKLNPLLGVLGKTLELAQKNTAMADRIAFWYSEEDNLRSLREELQQLLPVFGIESFTDLQTKSNELISNLGDNMPNTGHVVEQRDDAMSSTCDRFGVQFFPGAQNPTITGGELNSVGRDMINTNYQGKNIGASYSGQTEDGQDNDETSGSSAMGQFFPGASNVNITGGEFNTVGRDYNKTTYDGKNIGANYGTIDGQTVIGDSTTMTIQFPPT